MSVYFGLTSRRSSLFSSSSMHATTGNRQVFARTRAKKAEAPAKPKPPERRSG